MSDDSPTAARVSTLLADLCKEPRHKGLPRTLCVLCGKKYAAYHPLDRKSTTIVTAVTGSAAELFIKPMFSCVGDVDIMYYYTCELAVPTGRTPPSRLPWQFDRTVNVFEIVDSPLPGYVYLRRCCRLVRSHTHVYDVVNVARCDQQFVDHASYRTGDEVHGPASLLKNARQHAVWADVPVDKVPCVRCLVWPPQATDWPTRRRYHSWPDAETVASIVREGCDVVGVAHRQCRDDEWKRTHQWRLSFSRAEVVLLNSWTHVQQMVYHLLRVYSKTEKWTERFKNSSSETLSNYHFKTLMLWVSEQKPQNWWTNANIISICLGLLKTLADWLTRSECPHYFVGNCNLFYLCLDPFEVEKLIAEIRSTTEADLTHWFIDRYIRRVAEMCPDNISLWFDDTTTNVPLERVVSAISRWRQYVWANQTFRQMVSHNLTVSAIAVDIAPDCPPHFFLKTVCRLLSTELTSETDSYGRRTSKTVLTVIVRALHKTANTVVSLVIADLLWCSIFPFVDRGPHGCVLSLSARLSKVFHYRCFTGSLALRKGLECISTAVHSEFRGCRELLVIELSKAYLGGTLKCEEPDRDLVAGLAHVYLAVLYYVTGDYHVAYCHSALAMTFHRDHPESQCSTVDGKCLPKINDNVDVALGMSALYQYLRTAEMKEDQSSNITVFTSRVFAHYFNIKCLIIAKSRRDPKCLANATVQRMRRDLRDQLRLLRKYTLEINRLFIADLLLLKLPKCSGSSNKSRSRAVLARPSHRNPHGVHGIGKVEVGRLISLNSVENLINLCCFDSEDLNCKDDTTAGDLKALYVYNCWITEECFGLYQQTIKSLIDSKAVRDCCLLISYSDVLHLMGDEIVSLIGTILLLNPLIPLDFLAEHCAGIARLTLLLYLSVQCRRKRKIFREHMQQTMNWIDYARREVSRYRVFDHLVLKMIKFTLRADPHGRDRPVLAPPTGAECADCQRRPTKRGYHRIISSLQQMPEDKEPSFFRRFRQLSGKLWCL